MPLLSAHPCRMRIGILLLALASATGHAQTVSGELTLERAVGAALRSNPDLAANLFEIKAADARIAQAQRRPNPELAVELENFAGTGVARGANALESTLQLSQVLELGHKRESRLDVARSDLDLVRLEREARQLDVLAEVTSRFIGLVAAQDRLVLARNTLDLTQRTLDAIDTRVRAARSPEAERSRARIALTRARIETDQAQSELLSARAALAALWGDTAPTFNQAKANLLALEEIIPFESLVERLARNPDFARFASEARLRDAELRLARAQARPNLTVSVGARRLNETRDTALVAGFSIPLPLFDRNQGAIREAQTRRAQSDALREAAFLRARATVYALYQELLASRSRVNSLRLDAVPQSEQALEQTRYGYERGRFSYLELATAQQELFGLQLAVIDAAADYHRVLADIERLTGEAVSTTDNGAIP